MTHDVFISYSHHDKPAADAVCATLAAKAIRCWIAPRDIVPGQEWGEAIVDAIQSARVMVLVFSSHANDSPQVRREVQLAVSAETVLIPFRIEDVAPARALVYFLGAPHWLDAMTPPLEAHLKRLTVAVASFLAIDEPRVEASTQPATALPDSIAVPTYTRLARTGQDRAAEAAFELGLKRPGEGDVAAATAAYQQAIDSGHAEWAPKGAVNLGLLCDEQGDAAGAARAYQIAIDSGHAEWAPKAAQNLEQLGRRSTD